jgi:TRAP transporter TAXI family solute receptor
VKPGRTRLVLFGLVGVLMLAASWITFAYTEPPPPKKVTLATGLAGGAYVGFGEDLAKAIHAAKGPRVIVAKTQGSVENVRRLVAGDADVAFVQSGTVSALAGQVDTSNLRAIARVYSEPLWVFYRSETEVGLLRDLRPAAGGPLRVSVGAEGSGTNVIATQLLADNGVGEPEASLERRATPDAIAAFGRGELDVLFLIASPSADSIQELLHMKGVRLLSFANHRAYARRFPFLTAIEIDRGLLSLADDIPDRPIVLLAPSATLVTREDVHPRIVELFTKAAVARFSAGNLLDAPGAFPSADGLELPQHAAARRFMADGESWLSRHLPFWLLRLLARFKLILIPVITVLVPSLRFLPLLLRFRIGRLLKRKYDALGVVEDGMFRARTVAELEVQLDAIDQLRDEVAEMTQDLPGRYQGVIFDFRLHANMVRQECLERLAKMQAGAAAAAAAAEAAGVATTTSGTHKAQA